MRHKYFLDEKFGGAVRVGEGLGGQGLGGHAKLFILGFSPILEVFSGLPTGLT